MYALLGGVKLRKSKVFFYYFLDYAKKANGSSAGFLLKSSKSVTRLTPDAGCCFGRPKSEGIAPGGGGGGEGGR